MHDGMLTTANQVDVWPAPSLFCLVAFLCSTAQHFHIVGGIRIHTLYLFIPACTDN